MITHKTVQIYTLFRDIPMKCVAFFFVIYINYDKTIGIFQTFKYQYQKLYRLSGNIPLKVVHYFNPYFFLFSQRVLFDMPSRLAALVRLPLAWAMAAVILLFSSLALSLN